MTQKRKSKEPQSGSIKIEVPTDVLPTLIHLLKELQSSPLQDVKDRESIEDVTVSNLSRKTKSVGPVSNFVVAATEVLQDCCGSAKHEDIMKLARAIGVSDKILEKAIKLALNEGHIYSIRENEFKTV